MTTLSLRQGWTRVGVVYNVIPGGANVLQHFFFSKYSIKEIIYDPNFLSVDTEFNSLQTTINFNLKQQNKEKFSGHSRD
jgi:hypothetical protein